MTETAHLVDEHDDGPEVANRAAVMRLAVSVATLVHDETAPLKRRAAIAERALGRVRAIERGRCEAMLGIADMLDEAVASGRVELIEDAAKRAACAIRLNVPTDPEAQS